jgi:hypothetical protein
MERGMTAMIVRRKFDFLKLHVNRRLLVIEPRNIPLSVGRAVSLLSRLSKGKLDHGQPVFRPFPLVAQLLERSCRFFVPAFD